MNLLELYLGYHPNFMDRLKLFTETNRKRLHKKLAKENDKRNFLSTISEIKFGELFLNLGIEIEYDKKIDTKSPDWTLSSLSSTIIAEVYRLGKSQIDQSKSELESLLRNEINKIKSSYVLRMSLVSEKIEFEAYNIDEIIKDLELWLNTNPKVGDMIIHNALKISIAATDSTCNHVECITYGSIDYKINKVEQTENSRPNEITKKATKYNKLIEKYEVPYFICVDIEFDSGLNHDEFFERFKGKSVGFIDYEESRGISEFKELGSEWTQLGEFYENPQLSGIITCVGTEFRLLLNPLQKQIIYELKHKIVLEKLLQIG